jgi:hypothetical protein
MNSSANHSNSPKLKTIILLISIVKEEYTFNKLAPGTLLVKGAGIVAKGLANLAGKWRFSAGKSRKLAGKYSIPAGKVVKLAGKWKWIVESQLNQSPITHIMEKLVAPLVLRLAFLLNDKHFAGKMRFSAGKCRKLAGKYSIPAGKVVKPAGK